MTQELEYFKKLVEDRADSVRVFKKPSMRNGFRGVVDKYSDIAHFIYELLQNADDTRATKARFVLSREKLIFVHNGPRSFSVSDPASEEEDRASGHLGDLNAITSIGQSSKGGFQAENAPKIGKFGVGFKAVFSYTKTPSIYSPTFNFRLADYIVPSLLTNNHPLSNTGETLFDLPFDNPECPADKAFAEIKDKLQSLVSPLLFLNSLKEIVYTVQDQGDLMGIYTKETIEEHMFGDIKANLIQLKHENLDNDTVVEKLWLFSREAADLKNPPYSVGFYLDENNKLLPREPRAFCFFTTKEPTGLKFLIHAPFLLTDSREGIKAREKHNERMIELLAQLAADALVCLRDIGLRNGEKLIDDNILDVIPYVPSTRSPNEISFRPFYDKILNAFKTEKLLPTRDGYTNCSHAYWSDVADYLRVSLVSHKSQIMQDKTN